MNEPYLTQFCSLVQSGAGSKDIHDEPGATGYAETCHSASEQFIQREVERVGIHQRSLCRLLESKVERAQDILDVGCSTGGTSVALALSKLTPSRVIGVDPNRLSLRAAEVRALGYNLPPQRLQFTPTDPGADLPFKDRTFDLTVCVSVLEFISNEVGRRHLASEMVRVTKQGGHIFVSTPSHFLLREYHTGRWLGNQLRRTSEPWASSPRTVRRMFSDCANVPLYDYFGLMLREKYGATGSILPPYMLGQVAIYLMPWQKFLFRRSTA